MSAVHTPTPCQHPECQDAGRDFCAFDRSVPVGRPRVKVFATVRRPVLKSTSKRRYDDQIFRYAIELIARGSGTVMYRSKSCDTLVEAQALAFKYLARTPGLRFDPKVLP